MSQTTDTKCVETSEYIDMLTRRNKQLESNMELVQTLSGILLSIVESDFLVDHTIALRDALSKIHKVSQEKDVNDVNDIK